MFQWECFYPPHHVFFHNGSGSHRLLPSAVIHAQSCPRRPPPAPTEVALWSTTFPFVSVWIIDEAGEAQPKRLQAEWIVKEVQGVDGITQPLRLEALWTEYLSVYFIFLIDSSFNLQKVRNVKKKYHWCFHPKLTSSYWLFYPAGSRETQTYSSQWLIHCEFLPLRLRFILNQILVGQKKVVHQCPLKWIM